MRTRGTHDRVTPRDPDAPPIGISASAKRDSHINDLVRRNEFVLDPKRQILLARFKRKCIAMDKRCEFPPPDIGKHVRHVLCGKKIAMKTPFNTDKWMRHVVGTEDVRPTCKKLKNLKLSKHDAPLANTLTLLSYGPFQGRHNSEEVHPSTERHSQHLSVREEEYEARQHPCPGLSQEKFNSIATYLE